MRTTFRVAVVGSGYWGAGQTEKEAVDNSLRPGYLRSTGYTVIEFDQPVSDVEHDGFALGWCWTEGDNRTLTDRIVEGRT